MLLNPCFVIFFLSGMRDQSQFSQRIVRDDVVIRGAVLSDCRRQHCSNRRPSTRQIEHR